MRVMCINEKWRLDDKSFDFNTPVCGNEYVVISSMYREAEEIIDHKRREVLCSKEGVYYVLSGYPKVEFHAQNFAILPDKTADEMSQENREAIINIEHQPAC